MGEVPQDQLVAVTPAVRGAGADALRIAGDLRSAVASVGSDVDSVLGTWKGEAADAYASGWSELNDGARRIVDALHDLAEAYGWVADNYEHRDAAGSDSFTPLRLD